MEDLQSKDGIAKQPDDDDVDIVVLQTASVVEPSSTTSTTPASDMLNATQALSKLAVQENNNNNSSNDEDEEEDEEDDAISESSDITDVAIAANTMVANNNDFLWEADINAAPGHLHALNNRISDAKLRGLTRHNSDGKLTAGRGGGQGQGGGGGGGGGSVSDASNSRRSRSTSRSRRRAHHHQGSSSMRSAASVSVSSRSSSPLPTTFSAEQQQLLAAASAAAAAANSIGGMTHETTGSKSSQQQQRAPSQNNNNNKGGSIPLLHSSDNASTAGYSTTGLSAHSAVSSLDGIFDPDVLLDRLGFVDLDPPLPHEIRCGPLAAPGTIDGKSNNSGGLTPVNERLSEETLEDCHAFNDLVMIDNLKQHVVGVASSSIGGGMSSTMSMPSVAHSSLSGMRSDLSVGSLSVGSFGKGGGAHSRGGSLAGGSVLGDGDNSVLLGTLDEVGEDEIDEESQGSNSGGSQHSNNQIEIAEGGEKATVQQVES